MIVCAPMVTSGSTGECLQFVPRQAEIPADRGLVDAVARAQRGDLAPDIVLARQRAQPVVQAVERGLLGRRRGGIETDRRAADHGFDHLGPGDHHFQRDPPQPAAAFGEIAGDIDRQGCVEFAHHRQREIPVVAIAVVEGEAGETPREPAFDQSLVQFVHGHDVDVVRAQIRQHRAQELRRHFEMTIGLEPGVALRADMMQHENGADARQDRPQQKMRPGEVQRSQSGADEIAAKLLHSEMAGRFGCACETSGKPLKKQLFGVRPFSRTWSALFRV